MDVKLLVHYISNVHYYMHMHILFKRTLYRTKFLTYQFIIFYTACMPYPTTVKDSLALSQLFAMSYH